MALATKPVTIDGTDYKITTLGTSLGLPIYSKLMKALGPVARGVMSDPSLQALIERARTEGKDDKQLAAQNAAAHALGARFLGLIVEAVEALPTEFLVQLAHTFSTTSEYKSPATGGLFMPLGEREVFDQHFAGRYMHLTRWVIEHVKLNFTDFLASLVASVARARAE